MKRKEWFCKTLDENDILQNNEIQANKLVGFTMFLGSILLAVIWILCFSGIFHLKKEVINGIVFHGMLELLIPAVLCRVAKARKAWLKYLLLIELLIVLARIDSILGFNVPLIMIIPVILSCRFFSRRFTALISGLTMVLFALSTFANTWWNLGILDLNFYDPPKGTTLVIEDTILNAVKAVGIDPAVRVKQTMVLSYLPKMFTFLLISIVCVKIAEKGKQMVLEQELTTKKTARIETELNLANRIQAHMLPTIFPPFPDCEEIDLYAMMNPAKEVGGDFYDFFMIDENRFAMIIADVSGKGVPAALFMVITKTLLKNETMTGMKPEDVFTKVNHMLCEGNDDTMFVTAWMGILDMETGVLTYVNAGHNPPFVKRETGEFEALKSKAGFVLAGMDGIRYRQYEIRMQPGDQLFLYTDGVTEAMNPEEELYGENRLKNYLNAHISTDVKAVLEGLKEDIDKYARDEEQFDDITMLLMHYKKCKAQNGFLEKTFKAKENQLSEVLAFVEQELEEKTCPMKTTMQISVCVEEIFVNVAKYAYTQEEADVTIGMKYDADELTMRFTDYGIPFDPLAKKDPDISLPAEKREIGGLGIYIVKKTMDDVKYEYKNGMNILTMKKKIQSK